MTVMTSIPSLDTEELHKALKEACRLMAPAWPLDRLIAVNPLWHQVDQPFHVVADGVSRLTGAALYMPFDYYYAAWVGGTIRREHLRQAIEETGSPYTEFSALTAIKAGVPRGEAFALPSDILDQQRDLARSPGWSETITQQVSQFVAAYFDTTQSGWRYRRRGSLYSDWLRSLQGDPSVEWLMGSANLRTRAAALPEDAMDLFALAARNLALDADDFQAFLCVALLRINGWASWCAYQRWQASLLGEDDPVIESLLAIRVAWELLLDDGARGPSSVFDQWQTRWLLCRNAGTSKRQLLSRLWQRAHEIAYQRALVDALNADDARGHAQSASPPELQAAFCIDVRSEVFRRAFENGDGAVRTLGFAGFFGLPIDYTPVGTGATRPQLPGLLAPALHATDAAPEDLVRQRQARLEGQAVWREFERSSVSSFSFVESLGLTYGVRLVGRALGMLSPERPPSHAGLTQSEAHELVPCVAHGTLPPEVRADIAEGALRGMGMTHGFARIFLIVGHGSSSANNAHAAGLDCGACGGQTGEVNARLLAQWLNERGVRDLLEARGVVIPDRCVFIAGLHDTTTDEVTLYDAIRVPASHADDLARLRRRLNLAAVKARAERAPRLGLKHLESSPRALARALRRRARNWAETRPEWGLAGNAAMIIGPRWRTRDICLDGRVFLHEYAPGRDPEGEVLTQVMTAPMVVAHWINMQYYMSTVDNLRFGSGNKLLHNVVGGRIGVFEGNTGDLRIGLPLQSLHDGRQWQHEPLRLSVFIDAPRARIEAILSEQPLVRALVRNEWVYLFRLGGECVEARRNGEWERA